MISHSFYVESMRVFTNLSTYIHKGLLYKFVLTFNFIDGEFIMFNLLI